MVGPVGDRVMVGPVLKAFIGTFVNKIDAKGRISVPASFRTSLQSKGLNGVALFPSLFGESTTDHATEYF